LVRATIRLDPLSERKRLSFTQPGSSDVALCLNVLHFHFQESLDRDGSLWRPGAGQPAFFKDPEAWHRSLNLYRDFAVRPCVLPAGGFGVAIDVRHRYVQRNPLPGRINRNAFRSWKGRKFIYHFGEDWYCTPGDLPWPSAIRTCLPSTLWSSARATTA
jgi:hypothetical protein